MARGQFDQWRFLGSTDVLRLPATGTEPAAGWRIDRARYVAGQQDAFALRLVPPVRVGYWYGGHQRDRVRVPGVRVQLVAVGHLHDLAEVHHRDAVADVAYHGEVVRDEQVGELEFPLQVVEQVDDLSLDRHVERGHRLVRHDHLRSGGQRPGDADTLPLATGELVRVPVVMLRVQADEFEQVLYRALDPVRRGYLLDVERRGDNRADRVSRVQRRIRVLEDHLDITP